MPTLEAYHGTILWHYVPIEVIGYISRAAATNATGSLIAYIFQALFLLLAPVCFAASLYMVYSRVVRAVHGDSFSLVSPRWTTVIFVLGDWTCLNIQSSGSGLLVHPKQVAIDVPEYAILDVDGDLGAEYLSGGGVYHGQRQLSSKHRVADIYFRWGVDVSGDDRLLYLVPESAAANHKGLDDRAHS
ncbi:hypothetical protein BP5796_07629 [Coleophoma crateriformis]|uniref:Uncharacterized protein n=1 Tax=Coleophoma crateriformis TaxID=565419 RepID=A0A3D8RJG4_9HELO|nr:hypothetical protein BP5796_07629 [Coleophoma crateriformis]